MRPEGGNKKKKKEERGKSTEVNRQNIEKDVSANDDVYNNGIGNSNTSCIVSFGQLPSILFSFLFSFSVCYSHSCIAPSSPLQCLLSSNSTNFITDSLAASPLLTVKLHIVIFLSVIFVIKSLITGLLFPSLSLLNFLSQKQAHISSHAVTQKWAHMHRDEEK